MARTASARAISGCKTTARFKRLRPALREWVSIIQEYVHQSGEPPYFWGSYERVNCGLLAAALWRARIPTLQEFESGRKGQEELGRIDLSLQLGRVICNIEAKMVWPVLGPVADADYLVRRIEESLAEAERGARKYSPFRSEQRLALSFVVPAVQPETYAAARRGTALRQFTSVVQDSALDADIRAWCLPRGTARWEGCHGTRGGSYYYPAVAVLGRLVMKGKRRG